MEHPLAWLGAGVVIGAAVWPFLQPDWPSLMCGLLCAAILCACAPSARVGVTAWTAGGLMLGALSTSVQHGPIPADHRSHLRGEIISVHGSWVRLRTRLGTARVQLGLNPPSVGTQIAAWTRTALPPPVLPGGRDGSANEIRSRDIRLRARQWIRLGGAHQETPSLWANAVHGGVLQALATGNRSEVPEHVKTRMRHTGTIHLLAISGLHVGLISIVVAGLVGLCARPLVLLGHVWTSRWLAAGMAGAAAWAYGSTVAWPASAQRAGWMVGAVLIARALGRPTRPWNLLGAAAAVVTLTSPMQVAEIGFQLSFGAVAGILLWGPKVWAWVRPDQPWWARWGLLSIGATVGAVVGTLPVMAWDFQQLAPVGILANLVATPLIGTIAVPCALLAAHGPDFISALALQLGDASVGLGLTILGMLECDPLTPAVGAMAVPGLAVAGMLASRPIWAILLGLACLLPRCDTGGQLTVTFPDVGQGGAALIEWPDGRRWLVDGGPPSTRVLHWLRRSGIRRLDAVVLSHPHPDHMGGLQPVIEALDVGSLWAPQRPQQDGSAFSKLWNEAAVRGIQLRVAGDSGLPVIHPDPTWTTSGRAEVNNRSLVLRLIYGQHSFLLTGDIESDAENYLAHRLEPSTVVQVPHHGSRTSSGSAFVAEVRPRWAVVQAGRNNRFGHPAPEVLSRWGPGRILRTDRDGTIRFISDGRRLQVDTWRSHTGWRPVDRKPVSSWSVSPP